MRHHHVRHPILLLAFIRFLGGLGVGSLVSAMTAALVATAIATVFLSAPAAVVHGTLAVFGAIVWWASR